MFAIVVITAGATQGFLCLHHIKWNHDASLCAREFLQESLYTV